MSLKSKSDLLPLDIAFNGQPFCGVLAKTAVTVSGLDVAFNGEPVGYTASAGGGGGPGPGGSAQAQYIIAT